MRPEPGDEHLAARAGVAREGLAHDVHQAGGVERGEVHVHLLAGLVPHALGDGHRLLLDRIVDLHAAAEEELLLHAQAHVVYGRLLLVGEVPAHLLVAQLHDDALLDLHLENLAQVGALARQHAVLRRLDVELRGGAAHAHYAAGVYGGVVAQVADQRQRRGILGRDVGGGVVAVGAFEHHALRRLEQARVGHLDDNLLQIVFSVVESAPGCDVGGVGADVGRVVVDLEGVGGAYVPQARDLVERRGHGAHAGDGAVDAGEHQRRGRPARPGRW